MELAAARQTEVIRDGNVHVGRVVDTVVDEETGVAAQRERVMAAVPDEYGNVIVMMQERIRAVRVVSSSDVYKCVCIASICYYIVWLLKAKKRSNVEKIGIETILVSKKAKCFTQKHMQNPPKSTLGKPQYDHCSIVRLVF